MTRGEIRGIVVVGIIVLGLLTLWSVGLAMPCECPCMTQLEGGK